MKMHLAGNQCCQHINKRINMGTYELSPVRHLSVKFRQVTCKVCLKMVADIKTRKTMWKRRKS